MQPPQSPTQPMIPKFPNPTPYASQMMQTPLNPQMNPGHQAGHLQQGMLPQAQNFVPQNIKIPSQNMIPPPQGMIAQQYTIQPQPQNFIQQGNPNFHQYGMMNMVPMQGGIQYQQMGGPGMLVEEHIKERPMTGMIYQKTPIIEGNMPRRAAQSMEIVNGRQIMHEVHGHMNPRKSFIETGNIQTVQTMQGYTLQNIPVESIYYEQVPVKTIDYIQVPVKKSQIIQQLPPPPPQIQIVEKEKIQHLITQVDDSALRAEIEKLNFVLREKSDEIESWRRKCVHLEEHLREKPKEIIKHAAQLPPRVEYVEKPVYIEKVVDRPVEVIKYVDNVIEKPVYIEKIVDNVIEKPVYYEKVVEKPVEIIKYVDKVVEKVIEVENPRFRELEAQYRIIIEENRKLKITLEDWRLRLIDMEGEMDKEKQKRSAPPKVVEKIVEKRVEVPVPVEKIIEKRVEIPYEVVKYVDNIIEKRVEVPVEVVKYVDKVIEKRVEVPVEVVKYVDNIIEKRVEVPVEVVKYVDKIIEVENSNYSVLVEDYRRLQITLEEWRRRLIDYENRPPQVIERKIEVPVEVVKYVDKIIEKKVEVPYEVIKYVDKIVERKVEVPVEIVKYVDKVVEVENPNYKVLIEDYRRLQNTLEEWRRRIIEIENRPPQVIEKRIEVPVEVIKYVDKIIERKVEVPVDVVREVVRIDERRVRELEEEIKNLRISIEIMQTEVNKHEGVKRSAKNQENDLKSKLSMLTMEIERLNYRIKELEEDNRRYTLSIEELRIKVTQLENRPLQVIEKKIEVPVEEIKIDDIKSKELSSEIERLNIRIKELNEEGKRYRFSIEKLRFKITLLESRPPQVIQKRIEVPVEVIRIDDRRIRELEEESRGFRITIEELKGEREALKRREIDLQNKLALISSEIERLNSLLRTRTSEIDEWRTKYTKMEYTITQTRDVEVKFAFLNTEIERLTIVKVQYEKELEEWRYKYAQYAELTSKIQEYQGLFVLCFAEIEALRYVVRSKEREVDEVWNSGMANTTEVNEVRKSRLAQIANEIRRSSVVGLGWRLVTRRTYASSSNGKESIKKSSYY